MFYTTNIIASLKQYLGNLEIREKWETCVCKRALSTDM